MEVKFSDFIENVQSYLNINHKPFVIGIAGGSGSGKSFVSEKVHEILKKSCVISMDNYLIGENIAKSDNWDLPEMWDLNLIKKHLVELKKGNSVIAPTYDFTKHSSEHSKDKSEMILPCDVIILEGLYALSDIFSDILDFAIFVDADEKIRLERRAERDVESRGRTRESVFVKWKNFVQPTYKKYVEPGKERADLVVLNN